MKRILLTGAAGFIGFHVAGAAKKRGDFVLGLDNFNAYYSPALKEARRSWLASRGVEVLKGDICDTQLLKTLLQQHNISHVIHLAAQAGVRHSMQAPQEYLTANLQGFLSVLEAIRAFPHIPLTYASSSSVYGLSTKIPFRIEDPLGHPASFYGATKQANEAMAHSYHHLYHLRVTGLRYFTVYGPWGRPDMAYYHFAERIIAGHPIKVFNHGKMERDFTYIDDIVAGTLAAVDLASPCALFNLGNNKPMPLLQFISLLEQALGKKAELEMLPMQPGEVLCTYADISHSQKALGFQPATALEEGISHFAEWFQQQKVRDVRVFRSGTSHMHF